MTVASGFLVSYLDERLRSELWDHIARRLSEGDRLVTRRQFCAAIEAAYRDFTGQSPSAEVCDHLQQMVEEVHSLEPETYLAPGVQNAVMQAFGRGIYRLDWDVPMVESRGTYALRRFLGRDRVLHLFHEIRLDPGLIDLSACVRHGLSCARPVGAGARRRPAPRRAPGSTRPPAGRSSADASTNSDSLDRGLLNTFVAAAGRVGLGEGEVRERMREQEQRRDAILDAKVRRVLDRKVELAVSGLVDCLQVFEALKRISHQYDGLLQLLIRHREHVITSGSGDRTPLLSALLGNGGLIEQAAALMERRDPELRLLSVRLPPYNQVAPRKQEAVADMQIEESFVDDLRRVTVDQYGERHRSSDPDQRRRALDDIHSFILLLDTLVEPTPFRRKVRLLQVSQLLQGLTPEIEGVYGSTNDLAEARSTAARSVRQCLDRILEGASTEEETAARRRGQALLMAVEQKLVSEKTPQEEGHGQAEASEPLAEPVEELSQLEQTRGAQLVRLEVRGGGRARMVPGAIMPDPEDSRRFVMAQRDTDTGELVPQQRRGRNRYVERKPDGTWRALTG